MKLWYGSSAAIWEEALPLGNGRIGAMVFSGVGTEKISFNDDTLWSGYPKDSNKQGAAEHFVIARDLAMKNKFLEAEKHLETHFLSSYTEGYLPLGDLLINFHPSGVNENEKNSAKNYRRELNLETAIVSASCKQGGVTFNRECFVSEPNQCFVMRIASDGPGAISFEAGLSCQLRHTAIADTNRLMLRGIAPSSARPDYKLGDNPIVYEEEVSKRGMGFCAIVDFEVAGGFLKTGESKVIVENADEVIIRFCCRTSYEGPLNPPRLTEFAGKCINDISAAVAQNYETLRNRHIADYQRLYKRVEISFGDENNFDDLPSRLEKWETSENDPSLFALLFQFGRYLMLSGSRPGTTPLNLQGIWNPYLHPPWSSNYTININTEMNYWPAEVANLSECHEPLLSFIQFLRTTGSRTAKIHYGASGFVAHHNSDLWCASHPVGEGDKGSCVYAFWPLAAGWLSAHVFERYLFTRDKSFLFDSAWPILRDAARFFLDVLTEEEDGSLIFAPTTSPENMFTVSGESCSVSKDAAMTTAIIKETIKNAMLTCELMQKQHESEELAAFYCKAQAAFKKLPGYKIGKKGQLLEWSEELAEHDPFHRHTSHLYPLYPGSEIKPGTPLAKACARSLELRGEEATGWALAWRISLWARLHDGKQALKYLKKQLRPATKKLGGCYPNLFGAHPPYQIDSNFGATAGIAEMLLQSSWNPLDGLAEIHLLPTQAFKNGYVKGLRARGGITVDIYFDNLELVKAEMTLDAHLEPTEAAVSYRGKVRQLSLLPGQKYKMEGLVWQC